MTVGEKLLAEYEKRIEKIVSQWGCWEDQDGVWYAVTPEGRRLSDMRFDTKTGVKQFIWEQAANTVLPGGAHVFRECQRDLREKPSGPRQRKAEDPKSENTGDTAQA